MLTLCLWLLGPSSTGTLIAVPMSAARTHEAGQCFPTSRRDLKNHSP